MLWENRAEPILTGREELGFAKLYRDLPEPHWLDRTLQIETAWDSHVFMRMALGDLRDAPAPAADGTPRTDRGMLYYRCFPSVSAPGKHDIAQAVLTPTGGFTQRVETFQRGAGLLECLPFTWEQLPTLHHIVNTLAALPMLEPRGATLSRSRGAQDPSDQRVLRRASKAGAGAARKALHRCRRRPRSPDFSAARSARRWPKARSSNASCQPSTGCSGVSSSSW